MFLTLFKKAGVMLKQKKFSLFTKSVDYLGHVITPAQLKVGKQKTDAILEAKAPTTVNELRSIICTMKCL